MAQIRVRVERRGPVAWLRAADTPAALTLDGIAGLADVLSGLADDSAVRVAVLGGELFGGRWDWDATLSAPPSPDELRRLSATFQGIAESAVPLIAVIDGEALDAGLELALACDVRLASQRARFGFPASNAGLLPLGGGAARLARLAGRGAALRMLLTGEPIDAAEALACGLVSGVYPAERLAAEVERLADVIASRGPLAVRYAKEAVARGPEMPLEQALRFETDLTIILQTTGDRAEGVRAFAEKRPPTFHGQ